ncbi:MAG: extensin family protein [Ferrovibrio sp.]|nr:extensin family protein [Ferrovibrio sp.]
MPPAPQPVVVPVPPPGLKLWPNRDAIQSACLNDLEALGAQFELVGQAEPGRGGCTLVNGVKLLRTSLELPRPVELTCPMALRLMEFERDVLKPAALQHFGKPLRRLNHAGGFTCKRMTGNGSRVSEHGHGRAIDIWGFSLLDETTISIDRQWRARDRFGDYLREVARRSCDYFSVVLTPNSDAAHAKHFHWDIGQWKRCGL